MNTYFFKQALLIDGWHDNIRVVINGDGCISEVLKHSQQQQNDTVLDCVIPSLPNCHSHVFQRTMAGLTEYKTSENDSFWSWRDLMYKYANQISADQLYHIACFTYSEMLAAGFSSVCEFHYIHRDLNEINNTENMSLAIIKAAHDVGIRLTLLPVLYTQAHIDGSPLNQLQQRFKLSSTEYINLYHSLEKQLYPEQNMGLCFHSLRAVSITQMKQVLKEINNDQPIHIHIAEQQAEIDQIKKYTGKRPIELLYQHFDVNKNWCLIHATHLTKNETQLIAQSQATVGLCPLTEANLGDGVFPLSDFMKHRGNFAIGSDSNVLINPFQEIQMLEYSQRLIQQKRVIASSKKIQNVASYLWNKLVSGGAQASQLNTLGIQSRQVANWISLDKQHPILTHLNATEILDSFVFAHNNLNFETYIKGQIFKNISATIQQNYKKTLNSLR
ncbi:MAG: formimidoylglutamate deiminase [Marinicellaceae bacterium]